MQDELKYWYLHDHQLFSALSREENRALCLIPSFKTVKKSEILYFSHDEEQRLYTIKKGTLKIVGVDANGTETVKEILRSGDLLGNYTFTENLPNDEDEYAVAISETVVMCSFKIEDFEEILRRNPQLAIRYTKLVGFRIKRISNSYANLMFKDVKTRFALFLKNWIVSESNGKTKDVAVKNYLTHQDIAGLIGSTRQTVTQLFNELKEQGIIDYSRSEIVVRDLNQLG
jgi:CRP/FNR family transcriptional regulator, cyclic AMP receptor protein